LLKTLIKGKIQVHRGLLLSRFFSVAARAGAVLVCAVSLSAQTLTRAEDLYRHTQYEASLVLLDKNATDAQTTFLIGRDYFMSGDFRKATEYFQKTVTADPGNSDYMDWLGRAYGKRAETSNPFVAPMLASKARTAFERSVALDPKNPEALSDLFEYYLEAPGFLGGGYDKAAAVADKISVVDPPEGYFAKAQLAQKHREFDDAEQHLRQAAALAPHQVGRWIDLARFLAKQGRTRESDAVFAQAQTLDPNAPKVWFARADTLIKQKRNVEEARNLLQRYMRASITVDDPPKDDALHLLKQVGGA
jgi:Flp pilus assembly protein TadD